MDLSRGRFAGLMLAFLFLAALLPTLNSTRLQEVDELIYARVAQEAAVDGHWAPLTWGGKLWSEKPPLLLWLAALTAKWSGQALESWPYRLWSCLGAALCLFALVRLGALSGSRFAGLFAGALFALQGDLIFHARFFTMDTAMLGCALMAALAAAQARWKAAGLWLAAAFWIKSWFVLAFFPALAFALWRNILPQDRLRAALWVFGLALLGLAASLFYYGQVYGQAFWDQDLKWNLWDRVRGLSNERIESNWSYYGKWASRTAASLIPLALAVPLGLLSRRQPLEDEAPGFILDFAAMLALSWLALLCIIKAQVINYLLPMEAALCLGWALLLRRSGGLAALVTFILAFLSFLSARHHLSFGTGMAFSAFGAALLLWSSRGSQARGCVLIGPRALLHFMLFMALTVSGWRYLRHPDDPSRAIAEILLAHPAARPSEVLQYFGPETQALQFYSRYEVRRLSQPPRKLEPKKEAQLIFDGQGAHFILAKP